MDNTAKNLITLVTLEIFKANRPYYLIKSDDEDIEPTRAS